MAGKRNYIIYGPPGGGKGTQARLLAEHFKLAHIDVGKEFRRLAGEDTPIGRKAKHYVDSGELAPQDFFHHVLRQALMKLNPTDGLVIDGPGRTYEQVLAVDTLAKEFKRIFLAVLIKVSDEEVLRRIEKRFLCEKCNAPADATASQGETVCRRCGGRLIKRSDDNEVVMRHRLEVYHAETLKAVDYFRRQGRLVEIDGEGPVEKVSGRLLRALKRHEEGTKSAHPAYRLTKLPEEFPYLRKSGAILARVLTEVVGQVRPGITTQELNLFAEKRIRELGGLPAFKGYTHMDNPGKPFPATLCTSVNEELVHGIPGSRMVREGDIVGLDLGVNYHGYFTDMAVTIGVGAISKENEKLIEVTRRALDEGLKEIRAGVPLGNLSHRIQGVIEEAGFQVVRDLVGHGVGYAVHEPPMIPNYGRRGEGMEFMNNMVIAIEPMVTQKSHKVIFKDDGWTVEAADHLHSAHFEHTVIVTDEGYELLTKM